MLYKLKEIQVCVTGEMRWKKVWPHNTSTQTPCPHVESITLLKAMEVRSTRVSISPNTSVAEIYNIFSGDLGFVSEEDPPEKVGLINTTVQEPSAEADLWHRVLWTHFVYSLGVLWVLLLIMQNTPHSFLIHIESTRYSSGTHRHILFHCMDYSVFQLVDTAPPWSTTVGPAGSECIRIRGPLETLAKRACEGIWRCGKRSL